MKVKVALLIQKLEEAKKVRQEERQKLIDAYSKKLKQYEDDIKNAYKDHVKKLITHYEEKLEPLKKIHTPEDFSKWLATPEKTGYPYFAYGRSVPRKEWEGDRSVEHIEFLINKLKLSAEDVIQVRDHDDYFRWINL